MPKIRFLYRAIFSHLLVAVPPAVVLGWMVRDINRSALKLEAQNVHLSVASQLRDQLALKIDKTVANLDHAERILDMTDLSGDARRDLLRAIVASDQVDHLSIYGPSGAFDSLIRSTGATGEVARAKLASEVRQDANTNGYAVSDAIIGDGRSVARVVVPWMRDQEVRGFIGTEFEITSMIGEVNELRDRYLGGTGEIHVIDGARRYLLSTESGRIGKSAKGDLSPFGAVMLGGEQRGGLAAVAAGTSASYLDAEGEAHLGSIVSAPRLRWIVGTARSEAVAFASLAEVERRALILALIAALIAGLVALLLARQVSEPVRRLASAVRRTARDGFQGMVKKPSGHELSLLADSFNDVIGELDRHRVELRQKNSLQMRLSRFLPPTALHEVLSAELEATRTAAAETVCLLYADISTEGGLTEEVNGQALVTILGEFFAAATASVERNRGRIDRYSGEAVIGVFQASRNDDFRKLAVDAATDIIRDAAAISGRWQEQTKMDFFASVGLVTGEARVSVTNERRGELVVTGDVVERAAVLQRDAENGAILLDLETQKGLEGSGLKAERTVNPTLQTHDVYQVHPPREEAG